MPAHDYKKLKRS